VPFDASTLEWFPDENTYEDFPLPQNELPMFCFPRGLFLRHQKRDDAPMPSYFSFVFTSIDGDRVHVACLQFWELLPDRVLKALEVRATARQPVVACVPSLSASRPAASTCLQTSVGNLPVDLSLTLNGLRDV
jgi:hypothetical protein